MPIHRIAICMCMHEQPKHVDGTGRCLQCEHERTKRDTMVEAMKARGVQPFPVEDTPLCVRFRRRRHHGRAVSVRVPVSETMPVKEKETPTMPTNDKMLEAARRLRAQILAALTEFERTALAPGAASPMVKALAEAEPWDAAKREAATTEPVMAGRLRKAVSTAADEVGDGGWKVLAALVQFGDLSHDDVTAVTGYRSTSVRTYLERLLSHGYAIRASTKTFGCTNSGHQALRNADLYGIYPPGGAPMLDHWRKKVTEGEARVLALAARGPIDLASVQTECGYRSTSARTYLGRLVGRRLLVTESGRPTRYRLHRLLRESSTE